MTPLRNLAALVLFASATIAPLGAQTAQPARVWVGSWASAQQVPEPNNSLAPGDYKDATLRQIVHLSVGGIALRVHLSNAFGYQALHVTAVHIAKPLSATGPAIDPATDKALTFYGSTDVTIPANSEYISDPIPYPVAALSDLAISIHYEEAPARQTGHPGSRATSYIASGAAVDAADLPKAHKVEHWYQLSGVDVLSPAGGGAIVALGDSITDGHGATTNGNDRWTDVLARRLQADPAYRNVGVLNEGIGGNHMLTDGLGPNAISRFDRDVLAQTGVRTVILLEGVNDLGGLTINQEQTAAVRADFVHRLLASYEQLIVRAHAHNLRIIGATITPYGGSGYYHPTVTSEADRQFINQWIRTPGHFDAVLDFDKVLRDPAHPEQMLAEYNCGDHLHPSPAGYKAMGEAIPLAALLP
jgi:lysophospholipase L1-like esterase